MSAFRAPTVRPKGFAPAEISALVNLDVVRQHADDAAFLWTQRNNAVNAPHFKLKHLGKLDARVLAHLSGLESAGPAGIAQAQHSLADLGPGALFVYAFLAFSIHESAHMSRAVHLGLTAPALTTGLISALSWIDPAVVQPSVVRLWASKVPAHRQIALATLVAHRCACDKEIEEATNDENAELRALGLRAIAVLGRRNLLQLAHRAINDEDVACRFWASSAVALDGDTSAAKVVLTTGTRLPALRNLSIATALRCGELGWAREVVRSLAASGEKREAIQAVGILGDPIAVPWLLAQLDDAQYARAVGEAFSMITGVDLVFSDLNEDEPADGQEDVPSADADLPLPKLEALISWWAEQRGRFAEGQRYLAGQPLSQTSALSVLRNGYQRQRAVAAWEWVRLGGSHLFPVETRADWQMRRLSQ